MTVSTDLSTFLKLQLHKSQPIQHKIGQPINIKHCSQISQHTVVDEFTAIYSRKMLVPTFQPPQQQQQYIYSYLIIILFYLSYFIFLSETFLNLNLS